MTESVKGCLMPALMCRTASMQLNLKAGVGQASREETAVYTEVSQDWQRAMGI